MTMAPLVAKDKLIVGDCGGEMGVRGWAAALDQATGKVIWKAYSTGPDNEVLIGADFKPFYSQYKGKDLGVSTWPADMWKQGGGTVWGWVSYDPELNLVYYGTSNPGPWNSSMRPGDNMWTAGLFARDADTGQARWFYQTSPHDMSDYDGVNEPVLVDTTWNGRPRKNSRPSRPQRLRLHFGSRNGRGPFRKPVRADHQQHWRRPEIRPTFTTTTLSSRRSTRSSKDVCPAPPGGKDWQPSAFSNATGLLYIPHNNLCMDIEEKDVGYIAGTPFVGAEVRMKAGPGDGHRGEFTGLGHQCWKESLGHQ